MKLPRGIYGSLPYEEINSGLSVYPDIETYERLCGATHYGFRVVMGKGNLWRVIARPYANWKERWEAIIKES